MRGEFQSLLEKPIHRNSQTMMSLGRGTRIFLGASAISASGWVFLDKDSKDEVIRTTRTLRGVTNVGMDYYWNLRGMDKQSAEYKDALKNINIRTAKTFFDVCHRNGGLYTKLGQYMSTLNHALPSEFIAILQPLTDKAKPMPKEIALATLHDDLRERFPNLIFDSKNAKESGDKVDGIRLIPDIFTEFDEEPIAAASLAQVHRARMKDGQEVAVKIQYPYLKKQISLDLMLMEMVFKLESFVLGVDFSWIIPEFRENSLNELDFLQEGKNSDRMRNMIALSEANTHNNSYLALLFGSLFPHKPQGDGDGDVYIPKIRWDVSTKRVLVMEFVHGVRVDNLQAIKEMGIDPHAVAKTVSQVFSDMYFVYGFLHSDPHPGNLLIRVHPSDVGGSSYFRKRRHQLVILDHGMYRRLDPSFRRTYCMLWKALLTRDPELGLRVSKDLKLPDYGYEVLSLMLTYRSPNSSGATGKRLSKEDRMRLREKFKDINANDVNEFTKGLPRDILFVMRSTAIMRSVNLLLGGSSKQRFNIMGEAAVRGLTITSRAPDNGTNNINDMVDIETKEAIKQQESLSYQLSSRLEISKISWTLWLIDGLWWLYENSSVFGGGNADDPMLAGGGPEAERRGFSPSRHGRDFG